MVSETKSCISVPPAAVAWRLAIFTALWLILCGGEIGSWPFGVPTIIAATWLSFQLGGDQARSFRPLMLIRFIAFFLVRSVNSAVDVMMRVFDPRLPIDPALIEYPPSIEHDGGRILLANCITLLPGTISARLVQGVIIVHTLDKNLPIMASVTELEERIKTLYNPAPGEEGVQP